MDNLVLSVYLMKVEENKRKRGRERKRDRREREKLTGICMY
jgi:hypothetical protein